MIKNRKLISRGEEKESPQKNNVPLKVFELPFTNPKSS